MLVYDNNDQDSQDFEFSLFDLNGRILYYEAVHSKDQFYNKEMDVSFLASGMYFVQFTKGKEKVQKAFVKL